MENVNFISDGESGNEPFWGFQIISLKISISSQSLLVGDKGFFECDMSPPALTGLHVISRGRTGKCSKKNGSSGKSPEMVSWEVKLKEMDYLVKRA